MADTNDNVLRAALRGLRSNSIQAQRRKGDPKSRALMVSIGLADPEGAEPEIEEAEDEEEDDMPMSSYMRRGR